MFNKSRIAQVVAAPVAAGIMITALPTVAHAQTVAAPAAVQVMAKTVWTPPWNFAGDHTMTVTGLGQISLGDAAVAHHPHQFTGSGWWNDANGSSGANLTGRESTKGKVTFTLVAGDGTVTGTGTLQADHSIAGTATENGVTYPFTITA
jgi:hypothetical protein